MDKIILKRTKLEEWVDHAYFVDTVIGAFVRIALNKEYRLAEIVDVKEEGTAYELGKKKTNTQI